MCTTVGLYFTSLVFKLWQKQFWQTATKLLPYHSLLITVGRNNWMKYMKIKFVTMKWMHYYEENNRTILISHWFRYREGWNEGGKMRLTEAAGELILRLVWTMEFFIFTIFEISWFLSARGSILQVQAKINIFS